MHNIEFRDGQGSFVSHAEPAWHGLGKVVDHAMTATEALHLARMDWEVKKQPVFTIDAAGGVTQVPGKAAIYRDDPKRPGKPLVLAVMSDNFTPVQNVEAFAFLDALIEATGGAHFETAAVLGKGERVFLTVKMPEDLTIDPGGANDTIEQYILVSNGHDGTMSFTVAVTPVRVVCQNTLTMALNSTQRVWRMNHTKSIAGRIDEARRTIGLTLKYGEEMAKLAEQMIATSYSDRKFDNLVNRLYPIAKDAKPFVIERTEEVHADLRDLFRTAPTQENIRNTAWGAYQSVVEYADWGRTVRGGKQNTEAEKRGRDVLFGTGVNLKQKALDLVLAK